MLKLFFLLFIFLILSIVSTRTYCDECPSGCCNKYGGCPSYFQSCSCTYEKSYQIIDSGMKCKNCCDKNHCVNDLNKNVCDTVKKIQEIGKIIGAVIGGVIFFIILI